MEPELNDSYRAQEKVYYQESVIQSQVNKVTININSQC